MKWIAIAAGLAMVAPAWSGSAAQQATVAGPKVLLIGNGNTAGSVRAEGYVASGFEDGPVVSVHTSAQGVRIRDIALAAPMKGKGEFAFTAEYDTSAPGVFEIEVVVSSGSGRVGATGMERFRISVRRV